jgi:hypothetical protein
MAQRGKYVAVSAAGVGLLVLLLGAFLARTRLLEEWWLYKLGSRDEAERNRAIEKLGELGSTRAVRRFLELFRPQPSSVGRASGNLLQHHRRYTATDLVHNGRVKGGLGPYRAAWHQAQALLAVVLQYGVTAPGEILWQPTGDFMGISLFAPADVHVEVAKVLDLLRRVDAALARIGERVVPGLERAAGDESLPAPARAVAVFELARRKPWLQSEPLWRVPGGTADFTLPQRGSAALPGSDGIIEAAIGDITLGHVAVTVRLANGFTLVTTSPVREGEDVTFQLDGKTYKLIVKDLRNVLIGEDSATFTLVEGDGAAAAR